MRVQSGRNCCRLRESECKFRSVFILFSNQCIRTYINIKMCFLGSIGLGLGPCNVPALGPYIKMKDDEVDLGLGIRGEPGVSRIKVISQNICRYRSQNKHVYDDGMFSRWTLRKNWWI